MRLIKPVIVAAVVGASLATAGGAAADELTHFTFRAQVGSETFFTDGDNVRVSYRCTSRIRNGLIIVTSPSTGFSRRASARCDGVPRSVLLRVGTSKNVVLLQQFTSAFAEVAVRGRPCDTAACFG
jgi:hypothetical protein